MKRNMIHTIEAIVDEKGEVHLAEPLKIKGVHRALLTILEEPPVDVLETTFLSESSLSKDWLRAEEEEAWSSLQ